MASNGERKNMVDLQRIVQEWAFKFFKRNRKWKHKFLKEKDLDFDIDWSHVHFIHSEPDYTRITKEDDPQCPPAHNLSTLFKTVFENKTNRPQNYSFKTERTTSSSCAVEVQKGVTKGVEASLTLKTPCEVVEAHGGFKMETTVSTAESETVVNEMTWGVDSQIMVESGHKTTAKLQVEEVCQKDTYVVHSVIHGQIKVVIRKRKDNSIVLNAGGSIVKIIEDTTNDTEKKVVKVDRSLKDYPHPVVTYESHGKSTFRFGAEQSIDLVEERLQPEEDRDKQQ